MSDTPQSAASSHIMRWRGIASWLTQREYGACILALTLLSCCMVGMQLSYVVLDGAHLIVLLAPIAACAMLFGPLHAAVVGFLAGLAEYLFALYLPVDYFEIYFSAFVGSALLFSLTALVVGLLFALISRSNIRGWKRLAAVAASCLVGSLLFSLIFYLGEAHDISMLAHVCTDLLTTRSIVIQWLGNGLLMFVAVLLCFVLDARLRAVERPVSIRDTLRRWFALVVFIAYMACGVLAYVGISVQCRSEAQQMLTQELNYLEGQLVERDDLLDSILKRTSISYRVAEEVHLYSVESVASNYQTSDGSICVIAEDGVVISSNVSEFEGMQFEELVGSGLQDGFDASLIGKESMIGWSRGDETVYYMLMRQRSFKRAGRWGTYELMVAMPSTDVFASRNMSMYVVSAAVFAIFIAVYAETSYLLQHVVIKGFDETNEALSHITGGNLDESVDVRDSKEFTDLSDGINATVGALKNSLAESEARIERELMTANAIQASALPSTFPPFPDIDYFDIYASMDPAREVGGDFYDFFLIDDHTLGFLIADVSGKGIPAALFMMAAKTEIVNYMCSGMELSQAVQSANYRLCQGNDTGMFLTLWAATLEWEKGLLTYVNAGHNPPLLRRNGTWSWMRQRSGIFLGSFDTAEYRSYKMILHEGDLLLLYTDGVTEAFSPDEEEYGPDRLEAYLNNHPLGHPHALVDGLRSDVYNWSAGTDQSDDFTLLALEYGAVPAVTGSLTVPAELGQLEHVQNFIHAELARRLCPIDVQNKIDIALEEFFVNVCNYAYPYAEDEDSMFRPKCRIDYVYNASPRSITIKITDWGLPFNPLDRSDPSKPSSIQEAKVGGLGIFMARRLVDDISYLRDGDCNVITILMSW